MIRLEINPSAKAFFYAALIIASNQAEQYEMLMRYFRPDMLKDYPELAMFANAKMIYSNAHSSLPINSPFTSMVSNQGHSLLVTF